MPFVLLFVGLILVLFEFFSSGGLFAVLGGAAVIGSIIWAGLYTSSVLATLVFTAIAGLLTYIVVRFGIRQVRARIRIEGNQEGYTSSKIDDSLIGKSGKVITDLKPTGKIEIEGSPYPAISQKGYINKGDKVKVIKTELGHLIVR